MGGSAVPAVTAPLASTLASLPNCCTLDNSERPVLAPGEAV
jgi:hypothetical protein